MLKFAAIATTLAMTTPAVAAEPVPPTVLPPALAWSGASEKLVAPAGDPWITPAEAAGFRTTPRFDEMRSWLEHLDKASPLISVASFGKTGEGRDLLMVRASKGSAGKPVVLVQAGIHSGEIDGKDAGLMLLRDIAMRGKQDLLDRVDLVFVPILNIDGHERASPGTSSTCAGQTPKALRATRATSISTVTTRSSTRPKCAPSSLCCSGWIPCFT
ncbi:M14 family zinc carboxypeptidase [Novosphingobium panipatense]|uniref:M14 family zinc carboxypeptidase n=1 Tax=Novosphingobium panipatense TaxID=428991 RepID=UPI0036092F7A